MPKKKQPEQIVVDDIDLPGVQPTDALPEPAPELTVQADTPDTPSPDATPDTEGDTPTPENHPEEATAKDDPGKTRFFMTKNASKPTPIEVSGGRTYFTWMITRQKYGQAPEGKAKAAGQVADQIEKQSHVKEITEEEYSQL